MYWRKENLIRWLVCHLGFLPIISQLYHDISSFFMVEMARKTRKGGSKNLVKGRLSVLIFDFTAHLTVFLRANPRLQALH